MPVAVPLSLGGNQVADISAAPPNGTAPAIPFNMAHALINLSTKTSEMCCNLRYEREWEREIDISSIL
jgi:hypothetical protein